VKRTAQFLLAAAICISVTSLPLSAKNHGNSNHGNSQLSDNAAVDKDKDRAEEARDGRWSHDPPVFSNRSRDAIRDYYRASNSNLPPGLAKRNGNLPPGLRKQLRRNGTLPPGLQKRMQPLPSDVERKLPTIASGYSRGYIGQDVVIVNNRTQRIMDIISNVIGVR
jgi:hypothetical protein